MAIGIRDDLNTMIAGGQRPVSHAGLELDRYVAQVEYGGGKKPEREALLARLTSARPDEIYRLVYNRWKRELALMPHLKTCEMKARTPLQIGLGAESVLDLSLTLHKTYGTPLIPGSALKGLACRALPQFTGSAAGEEYVAALFGSAMAAGYVDYEDAWYVPDSAPAPGRCPLRLEGMTPHHPEYYTYTGDPGKRPAPTDCDDPNPVGGLSAQGDFLLVVRGPNDAIAEFALELLKRALDELGIGGKTSSSMGRLCPEDAPLPTVSATKGARRSWADPPSSVSAAPPVKAVRPVQAGLPAQAVAPKAAPQPVAPHPSPAPVDTGLVQRIEAVARGQEGLGLKSLGLDWYRLAEGPEKRAAAGLLHRRLKEANLLNNAVWEDYPWLRSLVAYVKTSG